MVDIYVYMYEYINRVAHDIYEDIIYDSTTIALRTKEINWNQRT